MPKRVERFCFAAGGIDRLPGNIVVGFNGKRKRIQLYFHEMPVGQAFYTFIKRFTKVVGVIEEAVTQVIEHHPRIHFFGNAAGPKALHFAAKVEGFAGDVMVKKRFFAKAVAGTEQGGFFFVE